MFVWVNKIQGKSLLIQVIKRSEKSNVQVVLFNNSNLSCQGLQYIIFFSFCRGREYTSNSQSQPGILPDPTVQQKNFHWQLS